MTFISRDDWQRAWPAALPAVIAVTVGGIFYLGGQIIALRLPSAPLAEITMNGTGTVKLEPTLARFTVTVETTTPLTTSEAAQNLVQSQFDKVTAALTTLGLTESDLRTTDFSITTDYAYGSTGGSTFRGYTGRGSLEVTLENPTQLQGVVTAAGKAGGLVSGVTFDLEDPDQARQEALTKAIQNAQASAEETAKALGRRLGKVTRIGTPTLSDSPFAFETGGAGGIGLPGGEQEIKVTADVTYELK